MVRAVVLLFAANVVLGQEPDFSALLASPSSNFEPILANPLEPLVADARKRQTPGMITGLLGARQACNVGWGYCPNLPGRCCPIGGQCCSNGHCCPSGQVCYLTGCCRRTESGCGGGCCPTGSSCCGGSGRCCAAGSRCVTIEGRISCCPNGQTCDACSEKGYPKCSNYPNYCCPRGQECYSSGSDIRCRSPPPPPPPPPKQEDPPPPKKEDPPPPPKQEDPPKQQDPPKQNPPPPQDPTTSTTTTTTRVAITTRAPTTTFSPSSTTQLSFPTTTAAPASGFINQVVSLNDPRLTYFGSAWAESPSTCFSSVLSKKASGGSHSVQFAFQGTGVFINVAKHSNAGLFGVTLLNDRNSTIGSTLEVDAYTSGNDRSCGIGYSRAGMTLGRYTLVVDSLGASKQAASGNTGTFELISIIAVVPQSEQMNTGPGNHAVSTLDLRCSYILWLIAISSLVIVHNFLG